jgi:5'-deoxynucleotidase YfbR-like HD superfamily hydrolase
MSPVRKSDLNFVERAIPGKKVQGKADAEDSGRKNRYEDHRKEWQLSEKWKEGRQWLVFTEDNTMTCKFVFEYYRKLDCQSKQFLEQHIHKRMFKQKSINCHRP